MLTNSYITQFMSEATDESGYALIQIKASIVYLESFDERELKMSKEIFGQKVEEQAKKCGVKYNPNEFVYKCMK